MGLITLVTLNYRADIPNRFLIQSVMSILKMKNNYHTTNIQHYRPDIDGLRALAVVSVVAYHAFPASIPGGFIGVDIFFVISGFLICGIILTDLEKSTFSISKFYQRRILRIFPALSLVLITSIVAGWYLLLADEYESLGKHSFGGAGFISNILLWKEVGYWDVASKFKPLLHLWSLGIEEQFYIFFPCILFIAWKKGISISTIILTTFFLSFILNIHYFERSPERAFYAPYTRFWELLAGAALATVATPPKKILEKIKFYINSFFSHIIFHRLSPNDGQVLNNIFSCIGCLLIILALLICRVDQNFPGFYALFPVFGTVFIVAAGKESWVNRVLFSNPAAVGIGLVSYSFYLWHWPILSFANILGWQHSGTWTWRLVRLVCVAGAFMLAFLTYKFVEVPIRFQNERRTLSTMSLIGVMVGIAVFGGYIYINSGLAGRGTILDFREIYIGARSGSELTFLPNEIAAAKDYAPKMNHKISARYKDVGSTNTVAVIGDSHSESAFRGIAKVNAELGLNTLLVRYNFWCPEEWRTNVQMVFKEKQDIRDVFVFYRGVVYLTGYDYDHESEYEWVLHDRFRPYLQETVNTFTEMGKQVYLVAENPVLKYEPRQFLRRPLSWTSVSWAAKRKLKPFPPTREEVLFHQKKYLAMLDTIEGATIIHTIDAFCPKERCLDFLEDGQVLYYDDDHLSLSGSIFLAEEVLAPYLEQIANRFQAHTP